MTPRAALWGLLAAAFLAGCQVAPVDREGETSRFLAYMDQRAKDLAIDPAQPLSLARCEELAVSGSLDLRVRALALRLQDEQVRLALTTGTPSATALYSDTTRSNRNLMSAGGAVSEVSDRRQEQLGVQGVLPVLDFGLTYYSYQIALDRRRQEQFLLARAGQLLRRDVRVAYARHAGAVRQEQLATVAYQAAGQVLRVARSLEREKLTARADTALIEAALAQAALDLSLSRRQVEETRLALSQLMSLPPGVPFRIDDALGDLPGAPSSDQTAGYEDRALRTRPELAVQDLQRRVSASSVRREASAFFPRLDLTGGFNWSSASAAVNPAFFLGGFQVSHALLDGGATIFRYRLARKTEDLERERSLLVSLGILYEVDLRALRVRQAFETVTAAGALEKARRAGLDRVISLYKEGLEDEAGAARSLADLTIQSTALDRAQTEYLVAWHELEAAVLPEASILTAAAATQPTSQPANRSMGVSPMSITAVPAVTETQQQGRDAPGTHGQDARATPVTQEGSQP